jgi:hypothetical protein
MEAGARYGLTAGQLLPRPGPPWRIRRSIILRPTASFSDLRLETKLSLERISGFVFTALLFSASAFWFWHLFTHADKIFFKH